ncbi:MAG: PQQ-binding-like beta-propeller repeat protein [Hyphomonadaceae bacterium]|nr:PQQ-binding-like beta-propeller repeat protein [Hyphomonadaceae bacterium]
MRLRNSLTAAAAFLGLGLASLGLAASPAFAQLAAPADHPGRGVYNKACATCHDNPGTTRAAPVASLQAMTPVRMREVLTEGVMKPMTAGLSPQEITDVIAFLSYGQATAPADWTSALLCAADKRTVNTSAPVVASGFGIGANQQRMLTAKQAGLKKGDMKNLDVAWAIAFPGQGSGTGPAILGDTVFITGGGRLLAVDAASGCVKWQTTVNTRNTPAIGDINGRKVLALSAGRDIQVFDAATGASVWKSTGQPQNGTGGSIRGGVIFAKDKIIVPLSASGVASGMNPRSECCTGHGSVVALSAADGKWAWEYHTMPEPTYNGQVNSVGVKQRGPSGAPIWSVPVFDEKRGRIIVTSGENTSHPGTDTSDAVIALDVNTGKVAWRFQAMAADVWNMACDIGTGNNGPNCPVLFGGDGRDYDFGAGAVIAKGKGGKDVVLAGQKSGHAWALDAETGKVLWSQRVGEGTALGGVHWGITTDGNSLFLPINDPIIGPDTKWPSKAGIYAFDIKSGKSKWSYAAKPDCAGERAKLVASCELKYGFSAAPLVVDGAVVGGTLGGEVFILDGKNGKVLKQIDIIGPRSTLNPAVPGKGGSIDAHGLSAGAGMIFVNSGYGSFGQTPGNVFFALKPVKK